MGFGTEILFVLMLGLLLLGPKRLHTVLGHVARVKAQFEEPNRGFKSQLTESGATSQSISAESENVIAIAQKDNDMMARAR